MISKTVCRVATDGSTSRLHGREAYGRCRGKLGCTPSYGWPKELVSILVGFNVTNTNISKPELAAEEVSLAMGDIPSREGREVARRGIVS